MASNKPPELNLGEDKAASLKLWRRKFNAWCLLQKEWRDLDIDSSEPAHWVVAKRPKEIAAFYLALPDDVLSIFDNTIYGKLTDAEKKQPWTYQEKLQTHFTGQDNVMPQRLAFFHCMQNQSESITDFENRIRKIAQQTRFTDMTDPHQELMRDRLCTGVYNIDLREILLHHFKDDGKTAYTFDEQLQKAKAWEAAHNTNMTIMQTNTKTDEQVNMANYAKQRQPHNPQRYGASTNILVMSAQRKNRAQCAQTAE